MNEIPLNLFIVCVLILFCLVFQAMRDDSILSILSAFIATILGFSLAKISINEQLVQNFGGIASNDTIMHGAQTIQNSAQAWFLSLIAILMTVRLLMILIENYKEVYGEVME